MCFLYFISLIFLEEYMSISQISDDDMCLAESASTHTILKDRKYFSYVIVNNANVSTICGSTKMIEGSERVDIVLHRGTKLIIENALLSIKSQRNLLSFKDIRQNGYHIETVSEGDMEYPCITKIVR